MKPPLHPALFAYLRRVQGSMLVGTHRTSRDGPRSARTIYRWQRSLGDQLLVIPNVTVEALGLARAHVFIAKPNDRVATFPYAVEAAWVTPDFCQEVLYLHCLVPSTMRDGFSAAAASLGDDVRVIWSDSGWQQFLTGDMPVQVPLRANDIPASDVLARFPFIIPALTELYEYPNSLPLVWHRVHRRLGERVKLFLPRTKVRYVNGKTHVTQAFAFLQRDGLVRQHVVRYHPLLAVSVEVFMHVRLEREDVVQLVEHLRSSLHGIETYPTSAGYWCRLLGPHRLLDAIIHLPPTLREHCGGIYFHTKRHPSPIVHFAYESLFDPVSRSWKNTP